MDILASAVGLGALAGLNLYLTVFLLSLSLRFDWLTLGEGFASLSCLDHPVIFWTSGALMVVEFFADKIPWVDSLWDVLHTFVRPVGAAALGLAAVGELGATWMFLAALLAGGAGLMGHATKAGGRLALNASPEPVSNSAASLVEDGIVIGGVTLWALSPWLVLGFLLLLIILLVVLLAWLGRYVRSRWVRLRRPS